jgi:tRNA-uridine 2-sulfurtransferase
MKKKKIKALGLLSGGLDSMLACKVLKEQGIEVIAISFVTPFFSDKKAKKGAEILKIPLISKDITKEHLKMLLNPKHGYGSQMNPCVDCHALMFKIAGGIMKKEKYDFLFSGEVLGERPMSQNKRSLNIVAEESSYPEYILRPLSAKLLPETRCEKEGKVDRSKLLDISGRQRKRQFELAKKYNMKEYPTPASGCLLTDPGFSGRFKDLIKRSKKVSVQDIELLKTGRHINLDESNKMIIGRNQNDNEILKKTETHKYFYIEPNEIPGPSCLIPKSIKKDLLNKAMATCASYCKTGEGNRVIFSAKKYKTLETFHFKSNRPKEFIGAT